MGFVKEKVYKGETVGASSEGYKEEDPTLRIPFDSASIKGLGMDDEVEVVLKGTVRSLKIGKESWDNGLELQLSSGSVKTLNKSEEESLVDSFMEGE